MHITNQTIQISGSFARNSPPEKNQQNILLIQLEFKIVDTLHKWKVKVIRHQAVCRKQQINFIHIIVVLQIGRSEEHTSELQSRPHLVCRLLLEKKKKKKIKTK